MNQFIDALNQLLSSAWPLIAGAGGVSAVTQIVKKLLSLENAKVIQVVFATVAFLATAGEYLLVNHNMPASIFGLSTAALMGVATPIYFYVIKPLDTFITQVRNFTKSQQAADPAVLPVDTLPAPAAPITKPAPDSSVVPQEFKF